MIRMAILMAALSACLLQPSLAAEASCREAVPLNLRVRFAQQQSLDAVFAATAAGGLRLLDARTSQQLWSGGADPRDTQLVENVDADLGASLAAVDLNADGVHDRIYAGDRRGRLWRFDLRTGADPSRWLRPTLLADLGAAGRGFVAAPDITLVTTATRSWLNIAIGSARIGAQAVDNRFYVLRDALDSRLPVAPVTEADLELLSAPLDHSDADAPGYYLRLGTAQVLAQALTLDGRTYFTAVESPRRLLDDCEPGSMPTAAAPLSLTVLLASDGSLVQQIIDGQQQSGLRRALPGTLPAGAGVELADATAHSAGRLPCHVATTPLADCHLDTTPQRTWWRREDAD